MYVMQYKQVIDFLRIDPLDFDTIGNNFKNYHL